MTCKKYMTHTLIPGGTSPYYGSTLLAHIFKLIINIYFEISTNSQNIHKKFKTSYIVFFQRQGN